MSLSRSTEKIFLLEPINFLNQFRRQPPANPLQFSIPGAIFAPCGKMVFIFLCSLMLLLLMIAL